MVNITSPHYFKCFISIQCFSGMDSEDTLPKTPSRLGLNGQKDVVSFNCQSGSVSFQHAWKDPSCRPKKRPSIPPPLSPTIRQTDRQIREKIPLNKGTQVCVCEMPLFSKKMQKSNDNNQNENSDDSFSNDSIYADVPDSS